MRRRTRWTRAWIGLVALAWSAPSWAQETPAPAQTGAAPEEPAAGEVARVPETAYGADGFNGPAFEDWLLGSPFRLVPRPRAETPPRLPRGRPVEGGFAGRRLLLTFDDGPFPETTPRLLEILRSEQVPAVFFLLAARVQELAQRRQGRRVARMIVQDGHAVGNHSFSHPHLTRLEPAQWKHQIVRAHDVVRSAVGYAPTLFRPPYGSVDAAIDRYLEYRGYTRVQWTYIADEFRARTPELMVRGILEQIREREKQGRNVGGVVLLHDAHARSVECAALLIRRIRAENCTLLEAGDEDVWRFVDADSFFQPIGAPRETEALDPPRATPAEVEEARTWCATHRDELDTIRSLDRLEVDINSDDFGRAPDGGGTYERSTDDASPSP
ncbi:MAG: polysaccharide deacetylase family protein [Deltaproteobacteria bacterium]|nr:polysaccharide deacetylase family protein [Deltaproteobacteria bacterium]